LRLRFSRDDRLLAADIKGSKLRLLRIAEGREFRTLTCPSQAGAGYSWGNLALDGRLLAVSFMKSKGDSGGGLALLDLASGENLTVLPIGNSEPIRFVEPGGRLTRGQQGLHEWPVQKVAPGILRFGPPWPVTAYHGLDQPGASADGRVLAIPRYHRCALLLNRDESGKLTELKPQQDVR